MDRPDQNRRGSSFFISYAREDLDFRTKLTKAMRSQGRHVWVDEDMRKLASWRDEVLASILAADVFVFVLSPDSLVSGACLEELATARSATKRIAPIVCRSVEGRPIPAGLDEPNWVFFRANDDFDRSLTELLIAADSDIEWVKTHTRMTLRAREWLDRDRDDSQLLRGRDLQTALAWLAQSAAKGTGDVGPDQIEFLDASRAREAEENARLREQYDRAVARQLAFQSELERASTPGSLQRSALLAAESIGRSRTTEGDLALRRALARLPLGPRQTLNHARGEVVALTSDGRVVVNAGRTGADIWDVTAGTVQHSVPAGPVTSLALDAQGTRLLTLDDRQHARLWRVEDGTLVREFDVGFTPAHVAMCVDVVALASEGPAIHLWDGAGMAREFAVDAEVKALALLGDGPHLIAASSGPTKGFLRVWDVSSGEAVEPFDVGGVVRHAAFGDVYLAMIAPYVGPWMGPLRDVAEVSVLSLAEDGWPRLELRHEQPVRAFGFTGNGSFLFTVTAQTVSLWRAGTGQPIGRVAVDSEPLHVAVDDDAAYLATAHADGSVRVTDLVAGAPVMVLDRRARALAFDADRTLVVVEDDRTELWSVAVGFELMTARPGVDPRAGQRGTNWTRDNVPPARFSLSGFNARMHGFSPDGGALLVTGPGDLATVLDTGTRDVHVLELPHDSRPAFTADGRHLVTASVPVRVLNIEAGVAVHEYERSPSPYVEVDEPSGRLAHASSAGDEVWVRDSATGEETHHVRLSSRLTGLRFSTGGAHLAITTGKGRLEILDLAADRITVRRDTDAGYVMVLDGEARYAVLPRGLFDVASGEYVALSPGDRVIRRVVLAPDSSFAAVAYEDSGLSVFALPDARELIALPGRRVGDLALLSAEYAATIEMDDSLHVVRLADGVDVMPPLEHPDEVRHPIVDRAGRLIATGGNDGWVRVWAWRVADLVAEARTRVGRELTAAELARFLPDEQE